MMDLSRRPAAVPVVLRAVPVLESWERTGHPDQLRLSSYLDEVGALIGEAVPANARHLALELTVGLPDGVALDRGGRDLDNYLFPVARRIGAARLDAAFGRKLHAVTSTIAVAPAAPATVSPGEHPLRGVIPAGLVKSVEASHRRPGPCPGNPPSRLSPPPR